MICYRPVSVRPWVRGSLGRERLYSENGVEKVLLSQQASLMDSSEQAGLEPVVRSKWQ